MKSLKEFKPLLKFVKDKKKQLIISCILIIICGVSSIFVGYLNGKAIEEVTKLNLKNSILYFSLYVILELVFDGGILYHYGYTSLQKIENYITRKLGYETYSKALKLPALAFEKMSSGEIINRITNDTNSLGFMFGRILTMLTGFLSSFIIIIYIFFNSWIIGIYILVFVILIYLLMKKYNPLLKETHKQRKQYQDKFTSLATESIRGIREIKTLGIRKRLLSDISLLVKDIFNKSGEEIDIYRKFNIINNTLKTFLEVGAFMICAVLLYYGKCSLTFFIAITYYIYRYTWLIENINSFNIDYQRLVVAITRVNEILVNRKYEDEKYGTKKLKNITGVVEYKDVVFAYPDEEDILNNLNLKLEPNKKIAIVGKSGQGKSTLFNLLTRIFDVKKGKITVDGIDIRELDEKTLRKEISVIRQEPFIFNMSILDNFKLIDDKIKLEDVRKYCKMSYLDDYIMSLPNKYDTILGEGGVNLSGGQKQRLSIARTLAKESKIILFDEATSALDNESQEYVKKSIDKLVEDHTVIIVAHRLSTIIDADIIYVIDKGMVVAEGNHNYLLKTSKIYKNLYETESLNS